jgi:hypothetical protein
MPQHIIPWNIGITARWYRANELLSMTFPPLTIDLVEEDTMQQWRITFTSWQAHRVTTEECTWPFGIMNLPEDGGGFFEVLDSEWIQALGKQRVHFLAQSRHFIVCCYDEIIEVIAHGYELTKLDRVGYPQDRGRIQLDPERVYGGSLPQGDDELSKLLRLRLASRDLQAEE